MMVQLRPVNPTDQAFLYQVYASTRQAEMALVTWTAVEKIQFLQNQLKAQTQAYNYQFPHADHSIILLEEIPIGRLMVNRETKVICVIDITLLPDYRNQGIGTLLMQQVVAEAEQYHQSIQLHVEKFTPALRLYQRLGFTTVADRGIRWAMVYEPN